jgi:transposase-like protein
MKRTKRTYDASDRTAALNAIAKGESPAKVAKMFDVPRTTLYRWLDQEKKGTAGAPAAPLASDEVRRLRDEERDLRGKLAAMKRAMAIMAEG